MTVLWACQRHPMRNSGLKFNSPPFSAPTGCCKPPMITSDLHPLTLHIYIYLHLLHRLCKMSSSCYTKLKGVTLTTSYTAVLTAANDFAPNGFFQISNHVRVEYGKEPEGRMEVNTVTEYADSVCVGGKNDEPSTQFVPPNCHVVNSFERRGPEQLCTIVTVLSPGGFCEDDLNAAARRGWLPKATSCQIPEDEPMDTDSF